MFILSMDKEIILNINQTTELFLSSKDRHYTVMARAASGSNLVMGRYETPELSKTALWMAFRAIQLGKDFAIPDAEAVKAEIIKGASDPQRHHATGKKTKGHGGS